jgi:hypothetical protein
VCVTPARGDLRWALCVTETCYCCVRLEARLVQCDQAVCLYWGYDPCMCFLHFCVMCIAVVGDARDFWWGMGSSTLRWQALLFIPLSRLFFPCVERIDG